MKRLLDAGQLPNLSRHLVERGCYRTALTVFPSTTGPAHIPFVCGIHPGTANIPGYRWLDRFVHDRRRRSIYRHRSLNSPRGLLVGRDMDREKSSSLYEYFDKPSSVLELIDYAPNVSLSKVVVRRLLRIVQAHRSDDWRKVDDMVEKLVIKRIRSGSKCVIGSFFGIDEYSHLYDPFDQRTIDAYINIDRAVGEIAEVLKAEGIYDQTIIAAVSDHGLSATHTHIPLVDIVKEHGFDPYFYPHAYRRRRDSAVMESGNAMAALYFKHGGKWGDHWRWEEMRADSRISPLIDTILSREGVTFVAARSGDDGLVIAGKSGLLRARKRADAYDVAVEGENPLGEHPVGSFTAQQLFEMTFSDTYPDAVNQIFLLYGSPRSGDLSISSEPGYDLRLQYEDPEHHSSHGSLHREHMQVPLLINVPLATEYVANYDIVPTILHLAGKTPNRPFDGRVLPIDNTNACINNELPSAKLQEAPGAMAASAETLASAEKKGGGLAPILVTVTIVLMSLVLTAVFKQDIMDFGGDLVTRWGQKWFDVVLFLITAVSSSPLALPIWAYTLVGVALGINIYRLALVMALGSATGSQITFLLGRYFGTTEWVKKRFPNLQNKLWAEGRSRWYVTLILFLGTASPIPCDVLYVAAGVKRYPSVLFWVTMVAARFVRYIYMGYGFLYGSSFLDKFL